MVNLENMMLSKKKVRNYGPCCINVLTEMSGIGNFIKKGNGCSLRLVVWGRKWS